METPRTARRRTVRVVITLVVLAFAIHALLPQFGELGQATTALTGGRWRFLLLAAVGSALTYVAGAWTVRASVGDLAPPWGPTIVTQVAAGAAAVVTPAGLGWVAINERLLTKSGIAPPDARGATTFNMASTVLSHVALLAVTLPLLPSLTLPSISTAQRKIILEVVAGIAVVVGIAWWVPRLRSRIEPLARAVAQTARDVARHPRRASALIAGSAAANVAYAAALTMSIAAFGPSIAPLAVLVVYLVAATVAAIAPTPGGLGAVEAALVSGLTRVGVPAGQAIAATLAFRMVTFWLPLGIGLIALRIAQSRAWI